MLPWLVHYKNKHPDCKIFESENSIDVFSASGQHLIAMRKNGANQWQDESEKMGCTARHCLAPLPKDARVHKVVDGKMGLDELHEERKERRKEFLDANGSVLSIPELKKAGYKFDDKGHVVEAPVKAPIEPPVEAPQE